MAQRSKIVSAVTVVGAASLAATAWRISDDHQWTTLVIGLSVNSAIGWSLAAAFVPYRFLASKSIFAVYAATEWASAIGFAFPSMSSTAFWLSLVGGVAWSLFLIARKHRKSDQIQPGSIYVAYARPDTLAGFLTSLFWRPASGLFVAHAETQCRVTGIGFKRGVFQPFNVPLQKINRRYWLRLIAVDAEAARQALLPFTGAKWSLQRNCFTIILPALWRLSRKRQCRAL